MKQRRQITIKEVAEHAGVSQMTVSRVLNQQSLVREETRERVEAAIRALNYRPNLMARGLAAGRSYYIGLIYNNPSRSYLGEVLLGALQRCREAGHHLVIEDFEPDPDAIKQEELAQKLRVSGLDGVIITPPLSENPSVAKILKSVGMAFVRIAPSDITTSEPSVTMDDTAAADAMTQYLIDKGHRKIGFIKGNRTHISSSLRYAGYKAALARNRIKLNRAHITEGDYTYDSGLVAGELLLNDGAPPTAIFASNDDMAAGVVAAAYRRNLKVPKDLSVVGFDDTAIASAIWPQLTTIRQPIADMAACSVDLLEAALKGKSMKRPHVVLDYSFVERDSVAAPPA